MAEPIVTNYYHCCKTLKNLMGKDLNKRTDTVYIVARDFINIFIFVHIITSESGCSLQWMVSWTVRKMEPWILYLGVEVQQVSNFCCSSPLLNLPPEECYFLPWKSKILRQRITKNLTSCLSLGEIIEGKTHSFLKSVVRIPWPGFLTEVTC